MIAKLLLTSLLCVIMLYAGREIRRAPIIGVSSLVVALASTYLVWNPSHASEIAHIAGIGRGVDLVIYLWVVISLLVMLNLHVKLRLQMELITALARRNAIDNAQAPHWEDRNQPAANTSPQMITAKPARSRGDSGSPNTMAPSSGVMTKASATNG